MSADLVQHAFHGQAVRVVTDEHGDPWFVASDVAKILGYRDAFNMIRRIDTDDRGTRSVSTPSGDQDMTVVTEAGLYAAVLGSQVSGARDFKRWVTHEVLPTIRRTGQYGAPVLPAIPQTYAEALRAAADAVEAREIAEAKVLELEPSAAAWDHLASTAHGDLSINETAKTLSRDNAVLIGERRLWSLLAEWRWVYRDGAGEWRPYQAHVDNGRLAARTRSHHHPRTGELVLDAPQVRVTPKGLQDIYSRLTRALAVAS